MRKVDWDARADAEIRGAKEIADLVLGYRRQFPRPVEMLSGLIKVVVGTYMAWNLDADTGNAIDDIVINITGRVLAVAVAASGVNQLLDYKLFGQIADRAELDDEQE